jgi:TolA-binding protein
MNSDKFDRVVLDLLYEELDELTTLAAKRHMEQSARARDIFAHLKATRRLSTLPAFPPPDGFEASVLIREPGARAEFPLRYRLGRFVSMLAGYAMRPQLAMGTLLLLMIGSSLLFLRAKPGHHGAIQVTERGVPEVEAELVLPVAAAPSRGEGPRGEGPGSEAAAAPLEEAKTPADLSPPAAPAAKVDVVGAVPSDPSAGLADAFGEAVRAYRAGQYVEAQRLFERISRQPGPQAAESALYAAQSTRNVSGCAAAIPRFERVRNRFPASGAANEAVWRAAKCAQKLGDIEGARRRLESLLELPSHAREARRALLDLEAGNLATDGLEAKERATAPSRAANTDAGAPFVQSK